MNINSETESEHLNEPEKVIEILLVEDNPGDVRLTKEALKESDVNSNLSSVVDGADAIEYLTKQGKYEGAKKPDLILLDLNLPKKDGKEVLTLIKSHEELKTIPVVVLTTSNAESDILKTYDLHANCYITKPVDFNQFIQVIKSIEEFWLNVVKLPSDI